MITLSEFTRYWARYRPDAEAVCCGDTRYTWREFNLLARRVAAGMQASGVEPGDRVGILLTNSAEWAVIYAAISICGGVIVPLNPRFGRFELRAIEADAECRVVASTRVHGQGLAERFDFGHKSEDDIVLAPRLERPGKPLRFADLIPEPIEPAEITIDPQAMAAIFYTSGTTGVPKGTVHTHASIQACIVSQMLAFAFTSDDRALILAPLAFTGGCLSLLAPMLMLGACAVVEPAYDPVRMMKQIERERITFITAVPAIWERLPNLPGFAEADFSSLRIALTGGAPVPVSVLEPFHKKGVAIRQVYGTTEGGGMLSAPTQDDALKLPASAGYPLLTVKLRVMSPAGVACAAGEIGEIWLEGPQVMTGYWRNPEATAAAFVDGWYKTGDLGFLDDTGVVTIVDRLKNMIISGGVNIYPAEVERALASIEVIEEIGVFGATDERWGERVVALIHCSRPVDVETILQEARVLLGPLKTPRDIVVSPSPLPRTVTNKISRRELPALYATLTGTEVVGLKARVT